MLIPMDPKTVKVGADVYLIIDWGVTTNKPRKVNVIGTVKWMSICGRYCKVEYSYCGHKYLRPLDVRNLKLWVDGRKKRAAAVRGGH